MAEQRQPFRFRLPWLPQPAAPRPTADIQTPVQPIATVPSQRPAFRPAGIAPVQPPPPQAQPTPRTESQPSSPARAPTESRVTSRAASPSRAATQSRAASLPPSPSRTAPQSRPASLPPSPPRPASQPQPVAQTAPQPRSPPRLASQPAGQTLQQPTTSQVQPTAGVVSQLPFPFPLKKIQPTTQESSQLPPPSSTQPPSSVSQRGEQKPALSQPESQKPQSKKEITQPSRPESQEPRPRKEIAQPSQPSGPVAATAPISKAVPEAPALPQPSIFSAIRTGLKPLLESEEKSGETKEGKSLVQEQRKEDKIKGPAYVASGTKTQTKEQPSVKLQEEQKQLEKQEVHERKETLLASGSQEKQFKTTHRMDRNTVGESRQKPGIFNRERAPLHKEIREDISRFVQKLGIGHPEQITSEEPVSVITLAGENRGAFMQLGSESAKKEGSVHIQRRYKTNQDKSAETTTDAEGSSEGRSSKYPMTKEDLGKKAYINSNIQSINNSILSDSSVTEKNPGVHLNLSHPVESIKSNDKTESFEAHKAEFNITPAEKLTYEPTVKRRCLRGLFMESSDSDPDNPEKPRRHGCRYGCGEKSKDKVIGIL